jgi:phosphoglycolate phosphatase-like HAD superfamily hydrolase
MREEVEAVGFRVGPGQAVEAMFGSSWDRKMPKDEVMGELFAREGIDPRRALVIGDGRTEIKAGADRGCVCLSRLPDDARRQRELHRELGTNYILRDYAAPELARLLRKE